MKYLSLIFFSLFAFQSFLIAQDYDRINDHIIEFRTKINPRLPEFVFRVYIEEEGNSDRSDNAVTKIEIRRFDSPKIIQTLSNFRMLLEFSPYDFKTVDINFDGYKDIMLEYNRGATGNGEAHTWLYSPSSKRFTFKEEFDFDVSAEIDSVQKTITDHWVGGIGNSDVWTYKVEHNKPVLIREVTERTGYDREYSITKVKCYKNNKIISVKVDTLKLGKQ